MNQLTIYDVKKLFDEGKTNIHIDRLYNLFWKIADNYFVEYDKFMADLDDDRFEVEGGEITLSTSSRKNYVVINNVELEDDLSRYDNDIDDDDVDMDDYPDFQDDEFVDDVINGCYDDELSSEIKTNF